MKSWKIIPGIVACLLIGLAFRMQAPDEHERFGVPRSGHWPKVRADHLEKHPECVVCGYRGLGVQVHHLKDFSRHPELECDPENLVTVCGPEHGGHNCHFAIAHLWNFNAPANPHLLEHATMLRKAKEQRDRTMHVGVMTP